MAICIRATGALSAPGLGRNGDLGRRKASSGSQHSAISEQIRQEGKDRRRQSSATFAKRTKNGKNTVAPLTQRALEAIDSFPPLAGCDYVFYNPETGDRWHDARRPWEAAREAAGYPWLRVRDLRPAFGIEASELGAPMHYIQSALGHGSVAVTERYYAKYDLRSAARQLLKVIEGGRQKKQETGTYGE